MLALLVLAVAIVPPTFRPHPPVHWWATEYLSVGVWITPDPDIRSVVLEIWAVDGPLVLSTYRQVDEHNRGQRWFQFDKLLLPAGPHRVIARIVVAHGISHQSRSHEIEVWP